MRRLGPIVAFVLAACESDPSRTSPTRAPRDEEPGLGSPSASGRPTPEARGGEARPGFTIRPDTVERRRAALHEALWAGPRPTTPSLVEPWSWSPFLSIDNLFRVERVRRPMAGAESIAFHLVPYLRKKRHLVLFHAGHSCDLDDGGPFGGGGIGYQRTVAALVEAGFPVVAMIMPGMEYQANVCVSTHPKLFEGPRLPGNPIRLFVEPVMSVVDIALSPENEGGWGYDRVSMVGLSGGGWTTTLAAAADPRIEVSIPVAGSLPLRLRSPDARHDEEQFDPTFYTAFTYEDLYLLGASGPRRRQVQVLNRRDGCCFGDAPWQFRSPRGLSFDEEIRLYEGRVRSLVHAVGGGGSFRVEIDEAAEGHELSRQALVEIVLGEIADDRRVIDADEEGGVMARSASGFARRAADGDVWEDWDEVAQGSPSLASLGPDTVLAAYRGPTNRLGWTVRTAGGSTSASLEAVLVADPVAVPDGSGGAWIAGLTADRRLRVWRGGLALMEQTVPAVEAVGHPVLASDGARVFVAARTTDDALALVAFDGAAWSVSVAGGPVRGVPAVAVDAAGKPVLAARRPDGAVWTARVLGGEWAWTKHAKPGLTGSPALRLDSTTGMWLYVPDEGRGTALIRQLSTGETTTQDLGGIARGVPALLGQRVVRRGEDGTLQAWSEGAWSSMGGDVD